MKNPNVCRMVMFFIITGGLVLAGAAGVIWGAEPLSPLFILGAAVAFGGIVFGIVTVRCPFCRRRLRLRGLAADGYCPHCGRKLKS
ncbi:MAG: hypothetical protein ACOX7J_00915 [Bacillota bacterium]